MSTKKQLCLMLSIFSIMLVMALGSSASAAITVDATFDPGALPSDFGMAASSGDVLSNVSGGFWHNTIGDSGSGYWNGASSLADIEGPVIHGFAVIGEATLTGNSDDQTLIYFSTDDVGTGNSARFAIYFNSGEMAGYEGPAITGFSVPVANTDLEYHTYGWEVDFGASTLKLFFDDVQVGDEAGIALNGNSDGENVYLGDGAPGFAHSEVWDRFVIAEGAYVVVPEPSMLMLLACGLGMSAILRFRR